MTFLLEAFIFLLAAVVAVPISRRLGFGSVLGYLAAGIAIGPQVLGLVADPDHILHFAELGVVLLLFIIGLELKPARLWVMRRLVFGLGAAQVIVSAIALALLALLLPGTTATAAAVIGLTLALSSTAFVLQMLAEKKQLSTDYGRAAFSVLLFQDLAVIPLLAIIPLLGTSAGGADFDPTDVVIKTAALAALIVGGRYLLRPVLRIVAGAENPELFTATALLVVVSAAMLMNMAGMSMVLGAFIAGMLLADSEYRHQLEADIAPFKGLLLGLFFIAVGMTISLELLAAAPLRVALIVLALMATKMLLLVPLGRHFGMCGPRAAWRLAVVLAQGGEFAFVLLTLARSEQILAAVLVDELVLAVAISMLLTPLAYIACERLTSTVDDGAAADYETLPESAGGTDVVIAGFGRVGQVIGRLLITLGHTFTALEKDPDQVDLVRRYGNAVHFGDASRLETLRAAGTADARAFIIATADMETSLAIAALLRRHFPDVPVVARARNRRHVHKLMDLGVQRVFRDTLLSSLAMAEDVLGSLGYDGDEAAHVARRFREYDEKLLREQHAVHDTEDKLIQSARDAAAELEQLMKDDQRRNRRDPD